MLGYFLKHFHLFCLRFFTFGDFLNIIVHFIKLTLRDFKNIRTINWNVKRNLHSARSKSTGDEVVTVTFLDMHLFHV